MALSKRLSMFTDIHTVLDAAVEHGGGRIALGTKGKAQHWCQRANHYRKLLHTEQEERGVETTSTPYDQFAFTRDPDDQSIVVIRGRELPLSFTAPDGNNVTLTRATTHEMEQAINDSVGEGKEEDSLLDEALNLKKLLTGEG